MAPFGPRVGRLGIHSALSLPLLLPGEVVGAINVYARGKDVFDDHAVELGELFAALAKALVLGGSIAALHRGGVLGDQVGLGDQTSPANTLNIDRDRSTPSVTPPPDNK